MAILAIVHSIWRTLERRQLRDIALVCLAIWVTGLSYGAVSVASGFPLWFPVLLGTLVLAASSEFLFTGVLAAGGGPVAAVLAALLVNARHVPFGLALPDVLGRGPRRLLGVHLMNDETVVLALAHEDDARRRAAYWACGLGVLLCWPAGALAGGALGSLVEDTGVFGLDALFPAVLLALIVPALKERATRRTALAGAAVALAATPVLPAGLPVLLALGALLLLARRRPGAAPPPAADGPAAPRKEAP